MRARTSQKNAGGFRLAPINITSFVVVRQVSKDIHAIVENSANLNLTVCACAIQQEVAGTTNATNGDRYAVSAMVKMVCPCVRGDLGARLTADPPRILGHIADGANQKRLVPQPTLESEPLVCPSKNRLDISLGNRRNDAAGHGINRRA
jgi:hypothetical protein